MVGIKTFVLLLALGSALGTQSDLAQTGSCEAGSKDPACSGEDSVLLQARVEAHYSKVEEIVDKNGGKAYRFKDKVYTAKAWEKKKVYDEHAQRKEEEKPRRAFKGVAPPVEPPRHTSLLAEKKQASSSPHLCTDTDNGATDSFGDPCSLYPSCGVWCGGYDDDDFQSNTMCCVCGGGDKVEVSDTCVDTDNGATDSYGDPCKLYRGNEGWCGGYDDDDFHSKTMCCACGGGHDGTGPPPTVAPTTTTPFVPPSGPAPLLQEVLDRHNLYRCMHDVPLMTWNQDIADNAQAWAAHGDFAHSPSSSRQNIGGFGYLGENLAWGATGANAIDLFYNEIQYTNGGLESEFNYQTGHYTQVVWKDSTALGCAVNANILVCQYGPGGNMQGSFTSQVLAPTKTQEQCQAAS